MTLVKKRPGKVQFKDCASIYGSKGKLCNVIINGILKEFVGIGWIDIRQATKKDYSIYSELEDPVKVKSKKTKK